MPNSSDIFLSREEAASFLRVHPRTLARWYAQGEGPPVVMQGRQILYLKDSLLAWLRSQERRPVRSR